MATRRGNGMKDRLDLVFQEITVFVSSVVMGIIDLILRAVNMILFLYLRVLGIIGRAVKLIMTHIPRLVSQFMSKKTTTGLNQQLIFAGVEMTAEEVISITLVYSVVVAVVAYLLAIVLEASQFVTIAAMFVAFGTVWAMPFILIAILTSNRADAVESTLPDVLSMVAQNMKAGMTSYNALWSAARPEFGPLAVELQDVAKATLTGIPLTDALIGMTNHVKSSKLPRSIRLIIQGMKSGGDLPAVLNAITIDMRREANLKKQMAAETSAHAIFILFAIMIGAPLLFAVSLQFITIFSTMMTKLNVVELGKNAPQGMVSLSPLAITPEFFMFYAIAILAVSGFFGSLLIGILRTGSPVAGVPSIPAFVFIPVVLFYVMKFVLGAFFSNMVQF